MRDEQVITVHGDDELVVRAGHLFAGVRTEFVCAARDLRTWSQPQARTAVVSRMRAPGPAAAELVVHKLMSPLALADEEQRRHLREVAANGAQVRISGSPIPHETIIIDRRVMILAGREAPGGREFTVTASPALVGGVHALFRAAWEAAADLDAYLRRDVPHLDPAARTILRALGSGLTDETAARHLGVSLRTYRRRVAELMTTLEAESRFQAGVRAGRLGLTG
jgi:DNA-binding NarL/FixJ family response regulator